MERNCSAVASSVAATALDQVARARYSAAAVRQAVSSAAVGGGSGGRDMRERT